MCDVSGIFFFDKDVSGILLVSLGFLMIVFVQLCLLYQNVVRNEAYMCLCLYRMVFSSSSSLSSSFF
jgi:hypothetical protein